MTIRLLPGNGTGQPGQPIRSMLAATLVLGGGSMVTSVIGVLAAKCWALFVGPGGVGQSALLLGISGLLGTVAGLSLANGMLRLGPELLAASDKFAFRSLVASAWSIWLVASSVAIISLYACAGLVSQWIGHHLDHRELACLTTILGASAATALQNGIINATHDIRRLAWSSIAGAFASLCATVSLLALLGQEGIAPALAIGALGTWLVSWLAYRSTMRATIGPRPHAGTSLPSSRRYVRDLCAFGVPFTASCLLGAGIQQLLPVIIVRELGMDQAGDYRAASTIGIGYIGVILAALGQDFYPRIAAAKRDPIAVRRLLVRQIRFSVALLLPIIVGMILCKEWLILICYSRDFLPAASLLPWFALGSLPKVVSWCIGYTIMATAPGWVFLISETITGMAWLASALTCMRWWGLDGLGVAFVVAYCTHVVLVTIILFGLKSRRPRDTAHGLANEDLGSQPPL